MPFPRRLKDRGGVAPSINSQSLRRVQRSRQKGARTPPGVIYVGRPTIWGNPFDLKRHGHAKCVQLFQRWLDGQLADLSLERMGYCPAEIEALHRKRATLLQRLPELAGQTLQCWCPVTTSWCHAEVLIARANATAGRAAAPTPGEAAS